MEVIIVILLGIITINVMFSPDYSHDIETIRSKLYNIQQELEEIKSELRQGKLYDIRPELEEIKSELKELNK